jgi:hypothetical protein
MDMQDLANAGATVELSAWQRMVRGLVFRLMHPYFAAILDELTAIRQELRTVGQLDTSDLGAIRNRLADIEDRLVQRTAAERGASVSSARAP